MVNDYVFGGLFIVLAILGLYVHDPWTACIASLFAIFLLGKLFREML